MHRRSTKTPTLVFTGGGTGGHIYPGLAVIGVLRERGFGGRIVWIGSTKESDRRSVEASGVEYLAIPSGKLRRSLSAENLADVFRVLAGYSAARKLLRDLEPALVFSKGGYVSVPPCRAAASLGIPVITHESDFSPGLATRLNARIAERIVLSYEQSRVYFDQTRQTRLVVAGNPVRRAFFHADPAAGRAFAGAPPDLPLVLFTGGSQGARQINDLAASIIPRLRGRAFAVHLTGDQNAASSRDADHVSIPSVGPEMPDLVAAADIVVARAGAGTLWECGALGKPMILIPLAGSGTRGDQVENARLFSEAGAASTFTGDAVTSEAILSALMSWLDDPAARQRAGQAAKALAGTDAAVTVADLILSCLGDPTRPASGPAAGDRGIGGMR